MNAIDLIFHFSCYENLIKILHIYWNHFDDLFTNQHWTFFPNELEEKKATTNWSQNMVFAWSIQFLVNFQHTNTFCFNFTILIFTLQFYFRFFFSIFFPFSNESSLFSSETLFLLLFCRFLIIFQLPKTKTFPFRISDIQMLRKKRKKTTTTCITLTATEIINEIV